MNKNIKRLLCFVLFVGFFLTFSCAPRVSEKSYFAENPTFDLLISYQHSPFKDRIVSKLIEKYQGFANIDVVGISTLKNLSCDGYDAIVIMDTCKAWSFFNFSMKSFIKKSTNCNNLILFMTAGDPEWTYRYKSLDAVTSASSVGEEDRVVGELTGRIDQKISLISDIKS